ncbi:MAG: hypothetical protein AAF415_05995 [Pseudomonadota bacterium]
MPGFRNIGLPTVFGLAITGLIIVSCTGLPRDQRSNRQVIAEEWHSQRMIILENPPVIAIDRRADIEDAAQAANRADPEQLAARLEARQVRVDALPYLIGSIEGQRFLQATGPRAIARGDPELSCPALGISLPGKPTGRADLAREALTSCTAALPPNAQDCGCRLIAIDNLVTVQRDALAYATGTSARLSIPADGIDRLLVAEEDGPGRLLLRDLTGIVATVVATEGEEVTVEFARGQRFTGRRLKVGFRRGRLAERIYAEGADGQRLSLLIGFEPDELADQAAAWLAWPKGG